MIRLPHFFQRDAVRDDLFRVQDAVLYVFYQPWQHPFYRCLVGPDGNTFVYHVPDRHKRIYRAIHADYRNYSEYKWVEIYDKVARSGEPIRFIEDSKALNRIFNLYAFRIGDPEERLVAVIFTDITLQVKAEEQLRLSKEKQVFMLKLTDSIRFVSDPAKIQFSAATLLGEYLPKERRLCSICRLLLPIMASEFRKKNKKIFLTSFTPCIQRAPIAGRVSAWRYAARSWRCITVISALCQMQGTEPL